MPTYEYRCDACSHEFELFQSMTAPVKRKCPACGKPRLQRLIGTGAGIIFKGGGFYETDYRSDSYKKAAEAEKKSAEPATEAKSETKTPATGSDASTKADTTTVAEPKPSSKAKENGAASAAKPRKRK